ncbi:MAG: Crp/Fnr family transcriptional regulator [bacterium]
MTDNLEDRAFTPEREGADSGPQTPRTSASFLDLLSIEDRTALIERCGKRVLGRRQVLFTRGEPRSTVFILRTGLVKLMRQTAAGNEVIITLCGPGELVGFSGLSKSTARVASAQVVEAGEAFVIDDRDFRALLAARPARALAVSETLRWRMESVADSLTDVVSEDVPNRIVRLLQRLAAGKGERRNGEWTLDLRLTHQELANMIGARRQTVTTAINDLHRDGVLRREQHRMVIPAIQGKGSGTPRNLFWASMAAGASLLSADLSLLALA